MAFRPENLSFLHAYGRGAGSSFCCLGGGVVEGLDFHSSSERGGAGSTFFLPEHKRGGLIFKNILQIIAT